MYLPALYNYACSVVLSMAVAPVVSPPPSETTSVRTDGIAVHGFLGQGDVLDGYVTGPQTQSVHEQRVATDLMELEAERLRLANQRLHDADRARAELFQRLFPR